MQNILAGAALGSIITLLIMVVWHKATVADLVADLDYVSEDRDLWQESEKTCSESFNEIEDRLARIIDQFKDGKSGTAKLAVKIARGDA